MSIEEEVSTVSIMAGKLPIIQTTDGTGIGTERRPSLHASLTGTLQR